MDYSSAYKWIVSRMKKYPLGGVVNHFWAPELMDMISAEIFPKNKDDAIIITIPSNVNYWKDKGYKRVTTKNELVKKNLHVPLLYKFLWVEIATDFRKYAPHHSRSQTAWVFKTGRAYGEPTKSALRGWRHDYVPVVALDDRVNEVVTFETSVQENFLFATFAQFLKHQAEPNDIKSFIQEAHFWPEVAYAKVANYESRPAWKTLKATTADEMELTDAEQITELVRKAIMHWCGEYSYDIYQYMSAVRASSMIKAIKRRIDNEPDDYLVLVQTIAQRNYLWEKLGRRVPTRMYSTMCHTHIEIPPVIFVPLGNLRDTTYCGRKFFKRVFRSNARVVIFIPENYDFMELVENPLYPGRAVEQYEKWLHDATGKCVTENCATCYDLNRREALWPTQTLLDHDANDDQI
ncbi:hypothetical protein [Singapore grouper iridovirus]|nr:hypothetical protein [Singapore grouper iridovirus]